MNISPEAHKLLRAKELDKDRQRQLRAKVLKKHMEDLERDRDTWKTIAILAMIFAMLWPAYKIGHVVLQTL